MASVSGEVVTGHYWREEEGMTHLSQSFTTSRRVAAVAVMVTTPVIGSILKSWERYVEDSSTGRGDSYLSRIFSHSGLDFQLGRSLIVTGRISGGGREVSSRCGSRSPFWRCRLVRSFRVPADRGLIVGYRVSAGMLNVL